MQVGIAMLTREKTVTSHEKIDDDDGHYIVTEDMPIGDRCENFFESADPQHR